jgi:hypothetical protein
MTTHLLNMPTRRHRYSQFAILICSCAVAVSTTILGPASASAEPVNPNKPRTEKDIKSDCADAGGLYSTAVVEGTRKSECNYSDEDGMLYVDHYTNGTFTGTTGPLKPKPTATPKPGATAVPPPGANTRAGTQ